MNEIVLFSRFCIFCSFSLLSLGNSDPTLLGFLTPLRLAILASLRLVIGVCFALLFCSSFGGTMQWKRIPNVPGRSAY